MGFSASIMNALFPFLCYLSVTVCDVDFRNVATCTTSVDLIHHCEICSKPLISLLSLTVLHMYFPDRPVDSTSMCLTYQ